MGVQGPAAWLFGEAGRAEWGREPLGAGEKWRRPILSGGKASFSLCLLLIIYSDLQDGGASWTLPAVQRAARSPALTAVGIGAGGPGLRGAIC